LTVPWQRIGVDRNVAAFIGVGVANPMAVRSGGGAAKPMAAVNGNCVDHAEGVIGDAYDDKAWLMSVATVLTRREEASELADHWLLPEVFELTAQWRR